MSDEERKTAHQHVIDGFGSGNLTLLPVACRFEGPDAEVARDVTARLMEGIALGVEMRGISINRHGEGETIAITLSNAPGYTDIRLQEQGTLLLQQAVGAMHQTQSAFAFERPANR